MLATILAQVTDYAPAFAQYGIVGAVLAWLMLDVSKKLEKINHTIQGLSRTMLMDLMMRDNCTDFVKQEAERLIEKMNKQK